MIDLNKNHLYLKLGIVDSDGNHLQAEADGSVLVAHINQLCTSFCERIIVKMSDKEIENSGGMYAYKAYIEILLNDGMDAKTSHLQLGMYYKDIAGQYNSLNGKSMVERAKPFYKNKGVEVLESLRFI